MGYKSRKGSYIYFIFIIRKQSFPKGWGEKKVRKDNLIFCLSFHFCFVQYVITTYKMFSDRLSVAGIQSPQKSVFKGGTIFGKLLLPLRPRNAGPDSAHVLLGGNWLLTAIVTVAVDLGKLAGDGSFSLPTSWTRLWTDWQG